MKNVIYYYEGETEKTLLNFLKNNRMIKCGKTKKFNLWNMKIKNIVRNFPDPKKSELFFIVDTDRKDKRNIFVDNIKELQFYTFYLIIQHKNLEDELCFSCKKSDNTKLYQDFYQVRDINAFKTKFKNEGNLRSKLTKNDFDFKKLWSRDTKFKQFLNDKHISVNTACNYKL